MSDIQRVVDRVENLMEKANKTGDDGYLDGVALNLHGFYVGIEHIFEDIVRNVYTFYFKASRLEELANGVRACYRLVEKDLQSFNHFLLKTAG